MTDETRPDYIYELIDSTDDEMYFTIGLFESQEDAVNEGRAGDYPPVDSPVEVVNLEVRKRVIGKAAWGYTGKVVAEIDWQEDEDGEWRVNDD